MIEINEVPYIELSDAAERLGLSKKETIELMENQGTLPEGGRTMRGFSLQTRLGRKTPLFIELEEIEDLARIFFSRN